MICKMHGQVMHVSFLLLLEGVKPVVSSSWLILLLLMIRCDVVFWRVTRLKKQRTRLIFLGYVATGSGD